MIRFDCGISEEYLKRSEIEEMAPAALAAHDMLHNGTGPGNEFTGWMELPLRYDKEEHDSLKRSAWKIRSDSDVLVVAGIGGSYLGAKAALDFLGSPFAADLKKNKTGEPAIVFAGNSISPAYHADLIEYIKERDVSVNVISKSGTTTEPAIAFRLLRDHMERKYGKKGASERIYATTDAGRGALLETARAEGYQTFTIPEDIGGRYSVLSPAGLLPIAVSGADIDAMLAGAAEAAEACSSRDMLENDCCMYAMARNILYKKGKLIEIMVNYEPSLHYFTEWWKQLYGESEGKDGKGIFPAGADFTTDLHSIGQYIQDGMRIIFETVLTAGEQKKKIRIKEDRGNPDGLDYLAGMDLGQVNIKAMEATMQAHLEGGVPQLSVTFPRQDDNSFGQLVYFFEKACAISGYMLGVNPFTQPGVEAYKKKMFALLGKPGYGV